MDDELKCDTPEPERVSDEELDKAIKNAERQIKKGYRITNYCIKANIRLVKSNPKKYKDQFIRMYNV